MAEDSADKTFEPTPRRRQQAREQGIVARSQDLGAAILLLVGVLLLMFVSKPLVELLLEFARRQWGEVGTLAASPQSVVLNSRLLLVRLARVTLPFLALMVLAGVMGSLLQTGLLFTPGRIAPDPRRISLAHGLRRILSLSGGLRLGFGLLKLITIVGVAAAMLWHHWPDVLRSSTLAMPQLARLLVDTLLGAAWWIGLALLALALMDYVLQRWRYEQDLRMTYRELREELKEQQGDPQIDARRQVLEQQVRVERVDRHADAASAPLSR
jgi:flagellar biosynthesis protein FlhB